MIRARVGPPQIEDIDEDISYPRIERDRVEARGEKEEESEDEIFSAALTVSLRSRDYFRRALETTCSRSARGVQVSRVTLTAYARVTRLIRLFHSNFAICFV